jgi:hypothetical protein
MMRWLFFALVAFAAWYGWHHYADLRQAGSHQLIIVNHTGHAIERLRLKVGEQVVVVETLENGAQTKLPFRYDHDGMFQAVWELRGVMGEKSWSGGTFSHGPVLFTHRFDFREDNGVIWSSDKLATK